jgi:hypothetical protein
VFDDISQSLTLFNDTIPAILRNSVSVLTQLVELYRNRANIDAVAILRPTVVGIGGELMELVRYSTVDHAQMVRSKRSSYEMTRVVGNIVDGLADVQCNNMQDTQLRMLDAVIRQEIDVQEGLVAYLDKVRTLDPPWPHLTLFDSP